MLTLSVLLAPLDTVLTLDIVLFFHGAVSRTAAIVPRYLLEARFSDT